MDLRLKDKVALITGSSRGIGLATAHAFAAEGCRLMLSARSGDALRAAETALRASGATVVSEVADVTQPDDAARLVLASVAAFGGIDILINCAAIFNKKGVLDMPLDEWQRQLAIILGGTFLFTKHVAKLMIDQGRQGSIINIISTAGHQGEPGNIAYCTGKSGLLNFTRSAAMELIGRGIRVNSLTPTATDPAESLERGGRWGRKVPSAENSNRLRQAFDPFRNRVAMQQLPGPSDYGKAAAFLASDDAAMITGIDLRVDAGAIAQYWAWDPSSKQS